MISWLDAAKSCCATSKRKTPGLNQALSVNGSNNSFTIGRPQAPSSSATGLLNRGLLRLGTACPQRAEATAPSCRSVAMDRFPPLRQHSAELRHAERPAADPEKSADFVRCLSTKR